MPTKYALAYRKTADTNRIGKIGAQLSTPTPIKLGFDIATSPFEKGGSRGIYLENLPRPLFSLNNLRALHLNRQQRVIFR
jgi:hypothetical protein